ncbi:unnamed protein product [Boreogadus saida]
MALCSDISALQQTVTASLALFEARLAALEKCKGLQDTVPMGEFAELTQIQHDQSHTVTFPNLDKRETAPAASHWLTVGAKAKQHTKVNQQAHSTPLKFTLQLKNRFQPLQEPTNATHAPLSPEMRPDGQCGQRRKNQSPRRRAVHVSATIQQGPISEKADEPDTLIVGDSTIKDITDSREPTGLEQPTDLEQPARYHQHCGTRNGEEQPPVLVPPVPSPPPPWAPNVSLIAPSPPDAIDSPPDAIAQVEKKTLKRDNSPSDADASYLSSPNVSSLCDFPAEYKRLEYVGSQFISGSLIASPCRGDRLITPKRMAPQPHHHTDICDEYF